MDACIGGKIIKQAKKYDYKWHESDYPYKKGKNSVEKPAGGE